MNVRAVVVQKGAHVQQIVNIQAQFLEISCKQSGAVDISMNDVGVRDSRFAKRLLGHAACHFVEVCTHNHQWMFVENLAAGSVLSDYRIQMLQKSAAIRSGDLGGVAATGSERNGILIERNPALGCQKLKNGCQTRAVS